MFQYLRGIATEILSDRVILEVGGVGFELICSSKTLEKIRRGREHILYTHLYLAEGIMCLYGFHSTEEREMFRNLIGVSRIGPKIAIAVLSKMNPSEISSAVLTESLEAFKMVPGLGGKSSQRIIMELKEKILNSDVVLPIGPSSQEAGLSVMSDAVAALISLGYDGLSASKAVNGVNDFDSLEDLIKKALRLLSV